MEDEEIVARIIHNYDPDYEPVFMARLGRKVFVAITESTKGLPVERCLFVRLDPKQGWRVSRVYNEYTAVTGMESVECQLN